jgi:hypothetical protein
MSEVELRLLAFWMADAAVWRRRMTTQESLVGEPTKIDIAKQHHNERGLLKDKAARIAAGKSKRPLRKIHGTLRLVETCDRLCSPTVHCVECAKPFAPSPRQDANRLYCSNVCRQRAKNFRHKLRAASYG